MPKTILCLVHDDRQGRKGGIYGQTAKKVAQWFNLHYFKHIETHVWGLTNLEGLEVWSNPIFRNIDAGMNGRAYKPAVIQNQLSYMNDGDFLIYNDCSPEIWSGKIEPKGFDFGIIRDLTTHNNDILTAFVKWDYHNIPTGGLGIHIHKYFTTNLCMDTMGMRKYENSYMHASGMMCIKKTRETVEFVKEWLHWNLIPECASLGPIRGTDTFWQAEHDFKAGHRHDQSISGLLLNDRNAMLVNVLHNDMNPYNFLQFCRKDVGYTFTSSNAKFVERDNVDPLLLRIGSKVRDEAGNELTVWGFDGNQASVGLFEGSRWNIDKNKLRLI